jgi:hypothetical protein
MSPLAAEAGSVVMSGWRTPMDRRRMAVHLVAVLASGSALLGCSSTGGTSEGRQEPGGSEDLTGASFGPPDGATEVSAMGSVGLVTNLVFVVDGRRYLVHTAPSPMVPESRDPARSATFDTAEGVEITATCGGLSSSSNRPDPEIAGPLVVSWSEQDLVVSTASQDDMGPCSPTQEKAEALLRRALALPRLSPDAWDQLVADHPIDLSGDGPTD